MSHHMENIYDFTNHIKHCIEEEHGITLSDKSIRDIKDTIIGANRVATKGSIANMKTWRSSYYDLWEKYNPQS